MFGFATQHRAGWGRTPTCRTSSFTAFGAITQVLSKIPAHLEGLGVGIGHRLGSCIVPYITGSIFWFLQGLSMKYKYRIIKSLVLLCDISSHCPTWVKQKHMLLLHR